MEIIAAFGFVFMCILLWAMWGVSDDILKDNEHLHRELIDLENNIFELKSRISANEARINVLQEFEQERQRERDRKDAEQFNDEEFNV